MIKNIMHICDVFQDYVTMDKYTEILSLGLFPNVDVKLIGEAVRRMIKEYHYVPFRHLDDIEGIFCVTCQDKNWHYFNAIGLYADIDPYTLFGKMIIIPNYTFEELTNVVKKTINMKAFL
jgi:hypothetical protein